MLRLIVALSVLFLPSLAIAAQSITAPQAQSVADFPEQEISPGDQVTWDPEGLDQAGRIEFRFTAPPTAQESVALAHRGDWTGGGGTWALWIWDGEVHARLGTEEIFRPPRPTPESLTPGTQQTVTLSWDQQSGKFGVFVNGELTILHPDWHQGMEIDHGPIKVGWPDPSHSNHVELSGSVAASIYETPAAIASCAPIGTKHGAAIDVDNCDSELPVCWQNPSGNEDGTVLTDLQTIRIYVGTESQVYTESTDIPATEPGGWQCDGVPFSDEGTFFLAATALDVDGNESTHSNEVEKEIALAPGAPIVFLAPDCADCQSTQAELLTAESGMEITIPVQGHDMQAGSLEIEMLEFPPEGDDLPISRGVLPATANEWVWIPGRAGLYYSRVRTCTAGSCGDWSNSNDQGFLYYVELAAPQGGGIE